MDATFRIFFYYERFILAGWSLKRISRVHQNMTTETREVNSKNTPEDFKTERCYSKQMTEYSDSTHFGES